MGLRSDFQDAHAAELPRSHAAGTERPCAQDEDGWFHQGRLQVDVTGFSCGYVFLYNTYIYI